MYNTVTLYMHATHIIMPLGGLIKHSPTVSAASGVDKLEHRLTEALLIQFIARTEERSMQFMRVPRGHMAATSFYEETSQGKEQALFATLSSIHSIG